MNLKIYKRLPEVAGVKYGSFNAACFDMSAYITFQSTVKAYTKTNGLVEILASQDNIGAYIDIPSEWRALIPTGIIMDIPENHSVRLFPRSGLSTKKGLNLINCVGIIDSDYVEQLFIPIYNNSQERVRIYSGDRIAQAELCPVIKANFNYIATRPEKKTNRDGGFGSTGVEWTPLNNS